jgi:hypothetical protein
MNMSVEFINFLGLALIVIVLNISIHLHLIDIEKLIKNGKT